MTTAIIIENPSPSFLTVSVDSGELISTTSENYIISIMDSDKISLLTEEKQGPAGPPGKIDDLEMPDLSLIFEGALI